MGRVLNGVMARRSRLVRTAAAVALAVSLVAGTFALTDTIDLAFERASTPSSEVDLIVRAAAEFTAQAVALPEREAIPDSVLATVEDVPGVERAWGQVSGFAELVDKNGRAIGSAGLPPLGTSFTPDEALVAGRAPVGPGEVVIDDATAARDGFQLGDRIAVLFEGLVREFTIAGLRKVDEWLSSTVASFDLATAQQLLGDTGRFDSILIRAEPAVAVGELRARVGAALPDRYEVVTDEQAAQEARQSWTTALGFLTTALFMFAAIALLVGAFIIFNTFSILVAQRSRELALLRAIGATRRHVVASVLVEATVVGAVGAVAGILLGLGAAHGLVWLMSAVGLELPPAPVVLRARTVLLGLVAGMVVTVAAAAVPARRATRISPVAAVGDHAEPWAGGTDRSRVAPGASMVLVGLVVLLSGLAGRGGSPVVVVAVGSGGVLVGVAMLVPLVARPAARIVGLPLTRLFCEAGALGRENAMRNPGRTSATAAALMIGITLVGVVSILGASVKSSAHETIERALRADFVVAPASTTAPGGGLVPPAVADELRGTEVVETVSEVRGGQWGLDGTTKTLLAVDPATIGLVYDLDAEAAAAALLLDDGNVLIRASVAARNGWRVGDDVPMTFARTGTRPMVLAETFTTTDVRSDYVIALGAHEVNYQQRLNLEVDVVLVPGTPAGAGRAAVEAALAEFPNVEVRDRDEVVADQQGQVDRVLLPMGALLGLSVVIALLGIVNTLALSIHERTREIGLLRAVGMARDQVRAMVRSEAVIIASIGAVVGVVVATFFGWALVAAMRDLGVTRLVFPVRQLAVIVVAAVGAGVVASVLPARRAARLPVLESIASE